MSNLKLPKTIGNIMEDIGFDPKSPKSTQIAFLKYIATHMKIKKYGYNIKPKKELTAVKQDNVIEINQEHVQASLFDDEILSKKKTS